MKLREFLEAIDALGLDPETVVVIQASNGTYGTILIEVCHHEYNDGGVAEKPDDSGGGTTTSPLSQPVLALDVISSQRRKAGDV